MNSCLEKELANLLAKMKKPDISLQESHGLYFEAKEKYLIVKEKESTKEASELILKILFLVGRISEKFIGEWQRGKIKPSNGELSLLKEGCDEVLEAFDNHFRKELLAYEGKPFNNHYIETKQKITVIRKLIQQETCS